MASVDKAVMDIIIETMMTNSTKGGFSCVVVDLFFIDAHLIVGCWPCSNVGGGAGRGLVVNTRMTILMGGGFVKRTTAVLV